MFSLVFFVQQGCLLLLTMVVEGRFEEETTDFHIQDTVSRRHIATQNYIKHRMCTDLYLCAVKLHLIPVAVSIAVFFNSLHIFGAILFSRL